MSSSDAWFVGGLVIAALLLEAWAPAATREVGRFAPRAPGPPPEPRCPRRAGHTVAGRPDGAVWCHDCDEGYFPQRFALRRITSHWARPGAS
jgi:hypothetical protein